MKATKKIVGAAVALVAAVALSAGSTFAWFSSNGEVTATGLQVDVKTDNSYLVIAANTGAISSAQPTDDLTTLSIKKDTTPILKPSAYKTVQADKSLKDPTKEGGEASGPSILTESTWYTAQGVNSADGSIKEDSEETLTATNFGDYVVTTDFVVSVSTGSIAVSHIYATMDVTLADSTKDTPIQVVLLYQYVAKDGSDPNFTFGEVQASSTYKKVEVAATGSLGTLDLCSGVGAAGADVTVSAYDHIAIKVMVYMDGNNVKVTTDNQANLQGATISFKFSDQAPTNPGT